MHVFANAFLVVTNESGEGKVYTAKYNCLQQLFLPEYSLMHYCSIQEGMLALGDFTLMLNCFKVASKATWLPEKYADIALWNSSSCLCITFTWETNNRTSSQIVFLEGKINNLN